jgi:phospholipase C
MKLTNAIGLVCFGSMFAHAQIANFQHIVVIVQENRTPDNLFYALCAPVRGANNNRCSTTPTASQYNIQTSNWTDKNSSSGVTQPTPVALANKYDLSHAHKAFVSMCDANSTGICKMDGADDIACTGTCAGVTKPQFKFVDNSRNVVTPYLTMAMQYGFANYMFQTNQGPSFPAHQFLFGGTSAPSAADDAAGIFASENMSTTTPGGADGIAGCTAPSTTTVEVINPTGGENSKVYPCFEHQTMADILPSSFTWRYYAPSAGSIWTAPNSIDHICESTGPNGTCAGQGWTKNVDLTPASVLKDIAGCNLRSMSWVIPSGENSDHANVNDGGGPSWVASIVNAIGNSSACDGGSGYWKNTAIFIVWDDWGGWYDHEPPVILAKPGGDYQYGFRVPLLVISAYTPEAYIDNQRHDFGSILRFVEHNFGITEGALNFADARANNDLTPFFRLTQTPRHYRTIQAPKKAGFFLHDRRKPSDPDDQ